MSYQITVRVTEELKGTLESTARRMQRKPSEVVRMALEAFLHARTDKQRPAQRVQHLLGSLDSATPDLAERHREYILDSLRHGQ